jgi:hypothetical protein
VKEAAEVRVPFLTDSEENVPLLALDENSRNPQEIKLDGY